MIKCYALAFISVAVASRAVIISCAVFTSKPIDTAIFYILSRVWSVTVGGVWIDAPLWWTYSA